MCYLCSRVALVDVVVPAPAFLCFARLSIVTKQEPQQTEQARNLKSSTFTRMAQQHHHESRSLKDTNPCPVCFRFIADVILPTSPHHVFIYYVLWTIHDHCGRSCGAGAMTLWWLPGAMHAGAEQSHMAFVVSSRFPQPYHVRHRQV